MTQRHPGLASLQGEGASAVFSTWPRQLSCTLQKANVAGVRGAAAGGARAGRRDTEREEGSAGEPGVGEAEEEDWLAEQVEELLVRAAAAVVG